jgi:hypothetical protein
MSGITKASLASDFGTQSRVHNEGNEISRRRNLALSILVFLLAVGIFSTVIALGLSSGDPEQTSSAHVFFKRMWAVNGSLAGICLISASVFQFKRYQYDHKNLSEKEIEEVRQGEDRDINFVRKKQEALGCVENFVPEVGKRYSRLDLAKAISEHYSVAAFEVADADKQMKFDRNALIVLLALAIIASIVIAAKVDSNERNLAQQIEWSMVGLFSLVLIVSMTTNFIYKHWRHSPQRVLELVDCEKTHKKNVDQYLSKMSSALQANRQESHLTYGSDGL